MSVWRETEGGGVDAHRKRHLNQDYLTPGNKREGAYGCCLDLIASQNTSEIAKIALGPGREPQYRGLCRGGIFASRGKPEPGGRVPWGMCVCTLHVAGDGGREKKEKERGQGRVRQAHGSL